MNAALDALYTALDPLYTDRFLGRRPPLAAEEPETPAADAT